MRETIALLLPLIFIILTVYLFIKKKINSSLVSIFLILSILSGLAIVNYDVIKKLKYGDLEIETFEREVNKIKNDAITEIQDEVNNLKALIKVQAKNTKSLIVENLKISSFELRARYRFEYKDKLKASIQMIKNNPIKAYLVNSEEEKDSLTLIESKSKLNNPTENVAEFNFTFVPENPSEMYGEPLSFLEPYEKIYFPWASFIDYLALYKLGGPVEQVSDPTISFQLLINGRVIIEQTEIIKDLPPESVVLIFRTEPDLFQDIEQHFLDLMDIGKG